MTEPLFDHERLDMYRRSSEIGLERVGSMLTRMIQRTQNASEVSIEHE